MLIPGALTSLRSERGFTLIETLMAMITGVIVTGALFAILEFSMHESTRISDVAQATQLGRTAMTRVIDEMHSACISSGFKPVQKESSATKLILVNGYSEGTEVPSTGSTTSTGVRKDEVLWSESAHTLTDKVYLSTSEASAGVYNYAAAKSVLIGEHITQTVEKSKAQPIFTYYEYAKEANTNTSQESNTLTKITPEKSGEELGTAQAEKTGSVMVRFNIAPTNNNLTLGRSVDLTSQVTFAFSAPDSETPIVNGPCE